MAKQTNNAFSLCFFECAQCMSFTVMQKHCARVAVITADRGLVSRVARSGHVTAARRERERVARALPYLTVSIPAEARGWNTGHLQRSITGKAPVFPSRFPPRRRKTEWRTKHRWTRGNSPRTLLRRFGCRIKTASLKNTFLKERVRMATWR